MTRPKYTGREKQHCDGKRIGKSAENLLVEQREIEPDKAVQFVFLFSYYIVFSISPP